MSGSHTSKPIVSLSVAQQSRRTCISAGHDSRRQQPRTHRSTATSQIPPQPLTPFPVPPRHIRQQAHSKHHPQRHIHKTPRLHLYRLPRQPIVTAHHQHLPARLPHRNLHRCPVRSRPVAIVALALVPRKYAHPHQQRQQQREDSLPRNQPAHLTSASPPH